MNHKFKKKIKKFQKRRQITKERTPEQTKPAERLLQRATGTEGEQSHQLCQAMLPPTTPSEIPLKLRVQLSLFSPVSDGKVLVLSEFSRNGMVPNDAQKEQSHYSRGERKSFSKSLHWSGVGLLFVNQHASIPTDIREREEKKLIYSRS